MKITKPKVKTANLISSNYDYLSNYVTTDQLQKAISSYNAQPKETVVVNSLLDVNGNYEVGTIGKNNTFKSYCTNSMFGKTNFFDDINLATNLNITGNVNGNDINKISYLADVNYDIHDTLTEITNVNNAQMQNLTTINNRLDTHDTRLGSIDGSIAGLQNTANQLSTTKADLSYVQTIDNNLSNVINTKVDNTAFQNYQVSNDNALSSLDVTKANLSYVEEANNNLTNQINTKLDILDFSSTMNIIQGDISNLQSSKVDETTFQTAHLNLNIAINNVASQLSDYASTNDIAVTNLTNDKLSKIQYNSDKAVIESSLSNLANSKSDITYVDQKFTDLMGGVTPATLDTINEIASALQTDSNSINTIFTNLSTKVNQTDYDNYVLSNDYNVTELQNIKANTSYVNTINTTLQSSKLDKTAFNSFKLLNDSSLLSIQTEKLNVTDFNNEKGYLQTDINSRVLQSIYDIDKTNTNSSITNLSNTKANITYVDSVDAVLQSNITNLQSNKADKSYVDSVDTVLQADITSLSNTKANIVYVDSADQLLQTNINTLASNTQTQVNNLQSADESLQSQITNLSTTKANITYVDSKI
jgi:hypothetical protein